MNEPDTVKGLFARYARLRQSRSSREDAWKRVREGAEDLVEPERKRLLTLIRDWEIIEGHRHKPSPDNDPHATHYTAPDGLRILREQLKSQSAQILKRVTREGIECPACEYVNPPGALRCEACGALLPQTKDVGQATGKLSPATVGEDRAHFGDDMVLLLEVVGTDNRVNAFPSNRRIVLGRTAPGSVVNPDVDLTVFAAEKLGVSRFHASLYRQDNTLVLTDLRSLNYTFVNGLRLYPHEVRVLRDGDELRLGQLVIIVRFQRAATDPASSDTPNPV